MRFSVIALIAFVSGLAHAQTLDARTEFEVASIKPSDPPVRFVRSNGGPGTNDPGLYVCENCSLMSLVSIAYDIPSYRITALDWMRLASFVVNAKVPPDATKEQFHLMMQHMLAERFKLAVHREQKELQIYELVLAKGGPKLKSSTEETPAEVASKTDSKRPASTEPAKLGQDGYPTLSEGMTQAMMKGRARIMYPRQTVEWFAGMISYQVHQPVIDATGLTGKYDFGLFWAYDDGNESRDSASNAPLAADPAPTLFEALQSQLGLKLEQKKGPVEIIVVDHMEKVPTEN